MASRGRTIGKGQEYLQAGRGARAEPEARQRVQAGRLRRPRLRRLSQRGGGNSGAMAVKDVRLIPGLA